MGSKSSQDGCGESSPGAEDVPLPGERSPGEANQLGSRALGNTQVDADRRRGATADGRFFRTYTVHIYVQIRRCFRRFVCFLLSHRIEVQSVRGACLQRGLSTPSMVTSCDRFLNQTVTGFRGFQVDWSFILTFSKCLVIVVLFLVI